MSGDPLLDFPPAEQPKDKAGKDLSMAHKELNLLIDQARGRLESLEILRDSMNWESMSVAEQAKMMTFFKMLR